MRAAFDNEYSSWDLISNTEPVGKDPEVMTRSVKWTITGRGK